jgi:hypothetical protein
MEQNKQKKEKDNDVGGINAEFVLMEEFNRFLNALKPAQQASKYYKGGIFIVI